MSLLIWLLGIVTAFAATAVMVPLLARLSLRKGWVDRPDGQRKLHARATPTVGGVAIALGFAAGYACFFAADALDLMDVELPPVVFWLGGSAMVLTGFYDDTRGLNFKQKLFVQICVAYLLLFAGYRLDLSAFPMLASDPYNEALFSMPLTLLWIVGIVNAVNLLDGLDGLAAGVVCIGLLSLGAIFGVQGDASLLILALAMGGALLGFLVYNFNPASIFMGDSGSLFLGYMVAVLSLSGRGHVDPLFALVVPVVALGLPVIDTGLSIVRRFAEHRAICAPDRDHIHHRLSRRWPQRRAVLVLYGVAALLGTAAFLMSILSTGLGLVVLAMTLGTGVLGVGRLGYLRSTRTARLPSISAPEPSWAVSMELVASEHGHPDGLQDEVRVVGRTESGDGLGGSDERVHVELSPQNAG